MPAAPERAPPLCFVLDSITKTEAIHAGHVAIVGSHGGVYPGYLAANAGLRGVIFSDAGVGLEAAGIEALSLLSIVGLAAAAVDYRTARIGDGADLQRRGVISHVNEPAAALGCKAGEPAGTCARKMRAAHLASGKLAPPREGRMLLHSGNREIWGVDSNSLLTAKDKNALIVSGSHGGLLGGNPATAVGPDVRAIAFNDAGIGIDQAGISRLPALDDRSIAAVTVSAASARIGDARSSWETGIISACNRLAEYKGARIGMRLNTFLMALAS